MTANTMHATIASRGQKITSDVEKSFVFVKTVEIRLQATWTFQFMCKHIIDNMRCMIRDRIVANSKSDLQGH